MELATVIFAAVIFSICLFLPGIVIWAGGKSLDHWAQAIKAKREAKK